MNTRKLGLAVVALALACTHQEPFVRTLLVYPVGTPGQPQPRFAEVVGLCLEKNGFRGVELAATAFRPAPGATFEDTQAAFGRFVAGQSLEADHALYTEFLGSPETGVQELRGVVVDRAGQVVWAESRRPRGKEPMICCLQLADRLEPILVPASPAEQEEEGPLTRLLAERSGLPDRQEQEAMAARRALLATRFADARVKVYPVRAGDTVDREAATQLVAAMCAEKLCHAEVAGDSIELDVKIQPDEQAMLWQMAREFRQAVRERAPDADYTMFCDDIFRPDGGVHGVHFVVCDRQGDWVIVDLQNNHHEDWQAIDPEDVEDCNRLVLRRLEEYARGEQA